MNIETVQPGRYTMRGDIVDVIEVQRGATLRSSRVIYILREKVRPRGALNVGEKGMVGIVNFASWSSPVDRTEP